MKLFRRKTGNVPITEEQRVIRLAGRDVPYLLKRSGRRTLALQVDERGLRVAVPGPARLEDIERFICGYEGWLLEKLALRAEQVAARSFQAADGGMFPLFGEVCRLRIGGVGRRASWRLGGDGVEELHFGTLVDPADALVRALKKRALPWYAERVSEYCFRLGIDTPRVGLSTARTRWGSCSSLSGIRLHWRLIHLRPSLIDYVVAHEVAHLLEMNHSPRFWAVVGELYPEWKRARQALRAAASSLPLIESGAGTLATDDY